MSKSKVGFLTSGGGGNPTGIGGYVNSLHNAGIPAVVMCNDGDVGISDALATGGNHVLLFRVVKDGSEFYSVPDYSKTPAAAAVSHWTKIRPFFHPAVIANKSKVFIQPINEVDHERADWLGNFGVEIARIANAEGYKVALFAFSSGEPEPGDWLTPGMIAYLKYCEMNKERAAVALHEYDYGFAGMENIYPWHVGRFEFLFNACDSLNIARPHVLITEFGWKYDNVPSQEQVLKDVDYAAKLYAKYPQVLGAAIWYLGPGFNGIANKVQPLIVPITNHTLTAVYPDPEPVPEPEPPDPPQPPTGGNMFVNGDMENGYTVYKDPAGVTYDNIRYPAGWKFDFARPNNPPNPIAPNDPHAVFRQPEAHVLHRANIPDHEEGDFFADGDYTWKIFGQNRSIHFPLWQDGKPPGDYDVSYHIFPDMYEWEGHKIFGTDPDCCIVWVETDVMTTAQQRPPIGQASRPVFRVTVGSGGWIKLWFLATWAFDNNGLWLDGVTAVPVNVTPPPDPEPPPSTLNEALWNASQAEYAARGIKLPDGLGLWKVITAETTGFIVAHNEIVVHYENQGYAVQGAIDPKKVKPYRCYVWNAVKGTWYIEGPEDEPTSPFESWPLGAFSISQAFGANPDWYAEFGLPGHEGIDFPIPIGTPVKAVADGTVYLVHPGTGGHNYGLHIRVQHIGGLKTIYCHLSRMDVVEGQTVTAGQVIGLSGNSGNSNGPHLHMAFKKDGAIYIDKNGNSWPSNFINPWPYIEHLYRPIGRQLMSGWVYDYITEGSDGQGVNFGQNLNMRTGAATTFPLLGSVPYLSMIEITGPKTAAGWYPVTAWVIPAAVPVPTTVDLLPYLRGDGRMFNVKHSTGQQETLQVQQDGELFWLVKNSQYEAFKTDDLYIWRGLDTSPGPAPSYAERPGQPRYYRQFETGQQYARWCKRHMVVGETYTGPGHNVQFYYKDTCATSSANSGNATNKVTLVAKHASKVWNGITVNDVVELKTGTGETMYFGRGYGLVGWSSSWGSSAILELVSGPALVKESGCFS